MSNHSDSVSEEEKSEEENEEKKKPKKKSQKKDKDKDKNKKKSGQKKPTSKGRKPVEKQPQKPHTALDFWHGMLPNEDTAIILKENGEFLLRQLEHDSPFSIVLSVRWGNTVQNVIIENKNDKFVIQGSEFESINNMIDFYQVRKRPLTVDGNEVILEHPVRRRPWELRHRMIKLVKELGSGSYGTVYKGMLTRNRDKPFEVAVKLLTEMNVEAMNALWKEARVMQNYNHPNVVKFYGVANDFTPYYLVMELVKGGSVDNYLKANEKLPVTTRLKIILEAAQGLEYLHSEGCIHRDIAARNLLIAKNVKVADFGLTRKSKNYKIDKDKPMNLRWLAPDVYETEIVTKATDVYAFGITMYETFVQPYTTPYSTWDATTVYKRVVEGGYRLSPPSLMSRDIGDLMKECIGPPKSRPSFKMIVVFLKAQMRLDDKKASTSS